MSQALLTGISTAGMLIGLFIAWKLHTSHQMEIAVTPEDRAAAATAPFISVIVPARNEARNIRRCVEALLEQTTLNTSSSSWMTARPTPRRASWQSWQLERPLRATTACTFCTARN
jgi:cellulose synthase/poly-beta-1,6-N-acetylglucosamine synthase-like glycosyltransferase